MRKFLFSPPSFSPLPQRPTEEGMEKAAVVPRGREGGAPHCFALSPSSPPRNLNYLLTSTAFTSASPPFFSFGRRRRRLPSRV